MYPPQSLSSIVPSSGSKTSAAEALPTIVYASDLMTPTTYAVLDALTRNTAQGTPTLTPSTLQCIEETLGLVDDSNGATQNEPEPVKRSARQQVVFVVSEKKNGSSRSTTDRRTSVSSNSSCSSDATIYNAKRKRGGGRRKEERDKESELSKEEQERRRIRRERNKLAAARCRKKRVDLTVSLEQETEALEDSKRMLQKEIQQLMKEKDELESVLRDHEPLCKYSKLDSSIPETPKQRVIVKMEKIDENLETEALQRFAKPIPPPLTRPTSLPVAPLYSPRSKKTSEIAGVAITTPSSGIPGFSFDSLIEGGFTPIINSLSPSCANQQRSFLLPIDLSSPDSSSRKLVSL